MINFDVFWRSRLWMGLALCGACLLVGGPAHAAYVLGDSVADFTLDDLFGTPTSLHDFAGDIIVLNFFATWCPGCNTEAAILENNIHLAYQDQGVTVIAVDMQEPAATVQAWAADQGVTYRILLSPNWDIFSLFPQAGGYPYNAIIDRDLVLRHAQLGFDESAMIAVLNALLDQDPVRDEVTSYGQVKALYR